MAAVQAVMRMNSSVPAAIMSIIMPIIMDKAALAAMITATTGR